MPFGCQVCQLDAEYETLDASWLRTIVIEMLRGIFTPQLFDSPSCFTAIPSVCSPLSPWFSHRHLCRFFIFVDEEPDPLNVVVLTHHTICILDEFYVHSASHASDVASDLLGCFVRILDELDPMWRIS
jgi:hypothetical protein